jgi:ABC-type phosphate/phosphonate transport system substrate-binding protein
MGIVWKARQVGLNRLVAIKVILAGRFATNEAIRRFRVEAEAVARLRHPNIVMIHETGEHEGQCYLSMEYVDGPTLTELLKEGTPLAPERSAKYVGAIARGIQHAHDQGILHRDLKPSNILIDGMDQPRVADFGLAKRFNEEEELTLTGQMLGSPNYSPPEQLSGKAGESTPRSDVYSLGAILYHLITGRPPFASSRVTDTIHQVLTVEPVAPRQLDANVPRDLETICLKCLRKQPENRYGTALEVAEELDRYLRREPILARRAGSMERGVGWARRNPLATTFMLVLMVATGTTTWLVHRLWVQDEKNQDKIEVIRSRVFSDLELMWSRTDQDFELIPSETQAAMMNSQRWRGGAGNPLRLRVAVSVDASPFDQLARYEPMLGGLEERLGKTLDRPVMLDLQLSKFNRLDLETMRSGDLALRRLGALSYVVLHGRLPGCIAIVREDQRKDCVIFTRKGSGIKRLEDLAGRSFAFGDAQSTISMIAKVQLARAGVLGTTLSRWDHLDSHQAYLDHLHRFGLRKTLTTTLHSHVEVIESVREGRYDAGVARRGYIEGDPRREFEVIANFDSFANIWVSGEALDPETRQLLRDSLTHGLVYKVGGKSTGGQVTRFVEVNDRFLNPIREALTNEVLRFEGGRRVPLPYIGEDE